MKEGANIDRILATMATIAELEQEGKNAYILRYQLDELMHSQSQSYRVNLYDEERK